MKIKINELFISLQGEGVWTGTKSLFLRFATCNLTCEFCDTDFSNKIELKNEKALVKLIENHCRINNEIIGSTLHHIVLTGGEPTLQVSNSMCRQLIQVGFKKIHIETNGILDNNLFEIKKGIKEKIWVTCSPKSKKICFANEYKIVFTEPGFVRNQIKAINHFGKEIIYLQPMEKKDKTTNIDEVLEFLLNTREELRLSLQTHKLLKIH